MIYAQNDQNLYVNLYIGSKANIQLKDTPVAVAQETNYPWDGAVKLTVSPKQPSALPSTCASRAGRATSRFRVRCTDICRPPPRNVTLSINGVPFTYTVAKGYARIERDWKAGDMVQINMPMPVRKVVASDLVPDDRGMVALERGPLVYCAEQADNTAGVFNLQVPDSADLQFSFKQNLLGGMGTITGSVNALEPCRRRECCDAENPGIFGDPVLCDRQPDTGRNVGLAGARRGAKRSLHRRHRSPRPARRLHRAATARSPKITLATSRRRSNAGSIRARRTVAAISGRSRISSCR